MFAPPRPRISKLVISFASFPGSACFILLPLFWECHTPYMSRNNLQKFRNNSQFAGSCQYYLFHKHKFNMYLVFPYIHVDSAHKYMYTFFVNAINVCKSAFLVTFQSLLGVCLRNLVYPLIKYAQVLSLAGSIAYLNAILTKEIICKYVFTWIKFNVNRCIWEAK